MMFGQHSNGFPMSEQSGSQSNRDYLYLTVNDDTETNTYVPVYGYYCDAYLKCEYVLPASQLTDMTDNTIYGMTFYQYSVANGSWGNAHFIVFMKEVPFTSLMADDGYVGYSESDIVYVGPLDGTQSEMQVQFDTPYNYSGGNLLIGFYNTAIGDYTQSYFYGTYAERACLQGYSYNSMESVSCNSRNFLPKTKFWYVANPYPSPQMVTAVEQNSNNVLVRWYNGTIDWHSYAQSTFNNALGSTISTHPRWGYLYPNGGDYSGMSLMKVGLFSDNLYKAVGGNYTLNVILGGDTPDEGTVVSSLTVNVPVGVDDWVDYTLPNPVYITGNENVWVIWTANTVFSDWPAGLADGTDSNGSWWNGGAGWEQVVDAYGVFTIRCKFMNISGDFSAGDDYSISQENNRASSYYNVWRTDYFNSSTITRIATNVTSNSVVDASWASTSYGVYKWGVSKVYIDGSGLHESSITWSETIDKDMEQYVGVYMSLAVNLPFSNALQDIGITLTNISEPQYAFTYAGTTNSSGFCSWPNVRKGTYSVSTFFNGSDGCPVQDEIEIDGTTNYYIMTNYVPVIGVLQTPPAIYSGEALTITEPVLYNADTWDYYLSSPNGTIVIDYIGQSLDYSYNGWYLHCKASNDCGADFSNSVEITVEDVFSAEINPSPADLGYRPYGCWMAPYEVTIKNNGLPYTINSASISNSFFTISDLTLPVTLVEHGDELPIAIQTGNGIGVKTGTMVVQGSTSMGNSELTLSVSATGYYPICPDVWETAREVNYYPYAETLLASGNSLYDNYRLPGNGKDGPDAVFKLTFDHDVALYATVTSEANSKIAVYPEDFNGLGGPDLNNVIEIPAETPNEFYDSFEDGFSNWQTLDVLAGGGTWLHSENNPGGYSYYSDYAHTGLCFALCYSYTDFIGAYNTNSYMYTAQKYMISDNSILSFWYDYANDTYPEPFSVCIATVDNPTAGDFIDIWSNVIKTGDSRYFNWHNVTIDLSEYAGTAVYLAFHDENYDGYEIWIDDVELTAGSKGTRIQSQILYDQAQFVTHPGGYNGHDMSKLQPGLTTLGPNMRYQAGYYIGDDFVLKDKSTITGFQVYAYQTGSSTTSTITGLYAQIYDGDPNHGGNIIWGNTTDNLLTSTEWTGCYRTLDPPDSNRPIMSVTAENLNIHLPAGKYWLVYSAIGALSSGPWGVPRTILGETNTGDGVQLVGSEWHYLYDDGNSTPYGTTFQVYGYETGDTFVSIDNLSLAAGTYYLVASSTADEFTVSINTDDETLPLETQEIEFTEGWNWLSTNIECRDRDALSLLQNGLKDNGILLKSRYDFNQYDGSTHSWNGSLEAIYNEQMYQVKVNNACSFALNGYLANPSSHPITIASGWNWIGYLPSNSQSVSTALNSVSPVPGDIIKSRFAFSYYIEGMGWYGTLNTLEPGVGLMYRSMASSSKVLTYPDDSKSIEMKENVTFSDNHWQPNVSEYPSTMLVIADVELDEHALLGTNYEVAAFVGDECRGTARLMPSPVSDSYLALFTIAGDPAEKLVFRLYDSNEGVENPGWSLEKLSFEKDGVMGTIEEPIRLHFVSAPESFTIFPNPVKAGQPVRVELGSLSREQTECYIEVTNALGSVVYSTTTTSYPIILEAALSSGIYLVKVITAADKVCYGKLIVE